MLPGGEIQIQNAKKENVWTLSTKSVENVEYVRKVHDLLEGFGKTDTVLSVVTIGYAFGKALASIILKSLFSHK